MLTLSNVVMGMDASRLVSLLEDCILADWMKLYKVQCNLYELGG